LDDPSVFQSFSISVSQYLKMENNRIFDTELEKLAKKVVGMCEQVNQQFVNTVRALNENDLKLAKEVVKNDNEVDTLDVKIDKLCHKIFALQQPFASDLRYIISALKINNDLERIGDHAVSIAKRIKLLEDNHQLIATFGVDKLGIQTTLLFNDVLNLVKTHNLNYCKEIYNRSELLKENCETVLTEILSEMIKQSEVVVVASNILIIINLLERIASYSNNIAESITFVVEGEIVKHKKK
jgi:phosphate transport system protein